MDVETEAKSGSVATPFFKQSFKEKNFEVEMFVMLKININDKFLNSNGSIIIEVEYDIEDFNVEYVRVNNENLATDEQKATLEYPLDIKDVLVQFSRDMTDEMEKWEKKRNTGMKVSWYYTGGNVTSEPPTSDKNKVFTQLANVLHELKDPKGVWLDIRDFRKDFLQSDSIECDEKDWRFARTFYFLLGLSNFYGNVNTEPVYKEDITEETLETAAKMYIFMLHCPDRFNTTKAESKAVSNFFKELYSEHSKETIITTLGRSLFLTIL